MNTNPRIFNRHSWRCSFLWLVVGILCVPRHSSATTLQAQVDAAIAASQTAVTLTPGTYNIASGSAISLSGVTNLAITATNVNIVMNTYSTAISLYQCGNVSYYNGSIDYNPLPFVEGTINSVTKHATDHHLISANVTFDATLPSVLTLGVSGLGISRGMVTDSTTNYLKKGSGTLNIDSVASNGDGTYTVTFNPCTPIVDTTSAGDKISFPALNSGAVAILLEQCGGCLIQGVTIYSSPLIGIHDLDAGTDPLVSSSANRHLHNYIIPATGRFRSVNAGGIICRKAVAGPTINNNTITDVGDDGIAIHTYMAQVVNAVTSSTTCTIRSHLPVNNYSIYNNGGLFQSGHVVKMFLPNGSGIFGTASPAFTTATLSGAPFKTADGVPGTQTGCSWSPYTYYTYTLTFTAPVTLPANTWLQDESASATSFYLGGNTITSTRARGVYARGDSGQIYTQNISYTAMAGILVDAEVVPQSAYMGEGNLTDGMIINANVLNKTWWGWSNRTDNAAGAISVLVSDPTWGPWAHTNVTINSNTFNNCVGVQLLLQGVQNAQFRSNTINYPGVNNVSPAAGSALPSPNAGYSVVDGTSGTCNALVWLSNVDTVLFENTNIYFAANGANGLPLYEFDGAAGSPTSPPSGSQVTNITLWNGLAFAFKWH